MFRKFFFIFFLLFLIKNIAYAQYPGSGGGSSGGGGFGSGGGGSTTEQGAYEEDTTGVFYYYMDNPQREFAYSDTTLGNNLQQYVPMRDRDWDYVYLGSVGSAHQPLVYSSAQRRGLDAGFHQYDLYKKTKENLAFYNIKKPFTLVEHSQTKKEDSYFKIKFGAVFADGVAFALDYGKINQAPRYNYSYDKQAARNTNLATGISVKNKKGNYRAFLTYTSNAFDLQESGGLRQNLDTFRLKSFQSYLDIGGGAKLREAFTRHEQRSYSYRQTYLYVAQNKDKTSLPTQPVQKDTTNSLLKNKPAPLDSLAKKATPVSSKTDARQFLASHTITYERNIYKSYDQQPDTVTNFYKNLLTDKRGLRFFMQLNKLENEFTLSTTKARITGSNRPKEQRDFFEVGLTHSLFFLTQDKPDKELLTTKEYKNNLFLTGRWNLSPNEHLKIETYAHYGLAFSNLADYKLKGNFFYDLQKLGQLEVQFTNQLYSPNLLQEELYISSKKVWKNEDLKKTFETNLLGTYTLPKYGIELTGGYHLLQNYIYIDSTFQAVQVTSPMSIFQLSAKKNFRLGILGIDNLLVLQKASNEKVLHLPSLFAKHSLFVEGKPWKTRNNFGRLGFDLRYTSSYAGDRYMPLIGQFYNQSDAILPFFPAVDAFLNVKISRVLGFVKYENLTTLITKQAYYQVPYYPMYVGYLRIGFVWKFAD